MPWHIEQRDGQFCVIKDDDNANEGCHDSREEAEKQMAALYASENRQEPHAPIEMRTATLGEVDFPKRIIEVVAVPYEQEAVVEYRGELWRESFDRGSFDGIETRTKPIRANREHNMGDVVGKAVNFWPERQEGLVGAVRIARTPRGDETLALADEDMLSVSVGFGVRGSDQVLDRSSRKRRIKRAFLDHLAFVGAPAYVGAGVLAVRDSASKSDLPPLDTPRLDEVVAWMESRRVSS